MTWVWTAALLMLTACHTSSSRTARSVDAGPPRYEVSCPAEGDCNPSVALLVGLSAPSEPTRCTAALIGSRTAVTAGHCVARELKSGGACDGVWLGFAGMEGRSPEWIGCKRIASVSTPSATLLSPDYAIFELAEDTARPVIPLGEGEMAFGEVVQMVSVTADRFYDDVHQVRSRRCVDRRQPQAVLYGARRHPTRFAFSLRARFVKEAPARRCSTARADFAGSSMRVVHRSSRSA